MQNSGTIVPGADPAYWHLLTLDSGPIGSHEIPTDYDADDLFDINYVQSNDDADAGAPELPACRTEPAGHGQMDHRRHRFRDEHCGSGNVTVTATLGEYQTVDSLVQPASGGCSFNTINPHFFGRAFDTVYLTGLSGSPHLSRNASTLSGSRQQVKRSSFGTSTAAARSAAVQALEATQACLASTSAAPWRAAENRRFTSSPR